MKKCLILLAVITLCYLSGIVLLERAHTKIINEKQYTIDSITSDNIGLNINVVRYEIILDKIRYVDSNLVDSAMRNVE